MKPADQLKEWVKGESMHNHEHSSCCPDFSCCLGDVVKDDEGGRIDFTMAYSRGEWLVVQSRLNLYLDKALRNGLSLKLADERDI